MRNMNFMKKSLISLAALCIGNFQVNVNAEEVFTFTSGSTEFNFHFLGNEQGVTFDEAAALCEAEDATLARISSPLDFSIVEKLIKENTGDEFALVWIGLTGEPSGPSGAGDTERFKFVDGENFGLDFFATPNVKPWGNGQPDDSGGDDECVAWIFPTDGLWLDLECSNPNNGFVCRKLLPPIVSEVTFEDVRFTFNNYDGIGVPFEQAVGLCEADGGTLARISNAAEFGIALQLMIDSAGGDSVSAWIGLFADPNDVEDGIDTSRFKFVDGETEGLDFFANAGTLPWDKDNPNDIFGAQDCVAWFYPTFGLWLDLECNSALDFVCRFDVEAAVEDENAGNVDNEGNDGAENEREVVEVFPLEIVVGAIGGAVLLVVVVFAVQHIRSQRLEKIRANRLVSNSSVISSSVRDQKRLQSPNPSFNPSLQF